MLQAAHAHRPAQCFCNGGGGGGDTPNNRRRVNIMNHFNFTEHRKMMWCGRICSPRGRAGASAGVCTRENQPANAIILYIFLSLASLAVLALLYFLRFRYFFFLFCLPYNLTLFLGRSERAKRDEVLRTLDGIQEPRWDNHKRQTARCWLMMMIAFACVFRAAVRMQAMWTKTTVAPCQPPHNWNELNGAVLNVISKPLLRVRVIEWQGEGDSNGISLSDCQQKETQVPSQSNHVLHCRVLVAVCGVCACPKNRIKKRWREIFLMFPLIRPSFVGAFVVCSSHSHTHSNALPFFLYLRTAKDSSQKK